MLCHTHMNVVQDQGPTFTTSNCVSNEKSDNDSKIPDLSSQGDCSDSKFDDEELLSSPICSNGKMIHAMKLGGTSYNTLLKNIIHEATYKPMCFISPK